MLPFPSDRYLAKDTGRRASIDEDATGYHIDVEPYRTSEPLFVLAPELAEGLDGLDGFGTSAEIAIGLTFGPDVTALADKETAYKFSVSEDSPIWLISIDPNARDAGKPLPFVARLETDGNVLFLRPWRPLRASSWYAVVIRPGLRDATGRSFESPPGFREDLRNPPSLGLEGEGYARLKEVYSDPIVFALTFRTGSMTSKLLKLADEVRAAAPSAVTFTTRAPEAGMNSVSIVVEGWFTNQLYRNGAGKLESAVVGEEKIPFTLALPVSSTTAREPFPVVLAQHGFGSNRQWIHRAVANAFAREGMATLSIDAPNHGARGPGDGLNEDFLTGARETFGIWTNGDSLTFKGWYFRDLLRQQVLTHLQLLLAVKAWRGDVARAGNVPGADLNVDEAGYIGHSMGAVMGGVSGGVLPELKRVLLNVGGGRISDVFAGNEKIGRLALIALKPRGVSDGDAWRAINMLQTAIDPGDPINYVVRIGRDPFPGEAPRPLLMQNVLRDFLVPNEATFALARAVDAPLVGPFFISTPDIVHERIPAGGLQGDDVAALAFYRDIRIGGVPARADHGNQIGSDTGLSQAAPFLRTGVVVEPAAP